ncbi:retrovirus-related pol polyprotein from transposon TNT 1-94 [Tanacetum coccineum]
MPDYTKFLQQLVSERTKLEEVSLVKLNSRCSTVLQNELPPKEKDPRSFILPCIIVNTTVSNALADLGVSISVMPFSMFKRFGLGTPKPINIVIEMADKSMQSPKGIVENVLVKFDKFIFPMDFVILDIVEDNKVPIILGRPMLATAYAKIDVFGKKICLEVGMEKVVFNANEGRTLLSVGDFLEENDLLPGIDLDSFEVLPDFDDEMGIGLDLDRFGDRDRNFFGEAFFWKLRIP